MSLPSIAEGTVVLGAGLSGLGCARALPGARLYEGKAHAGGHAFSHSQGGFAFDEGAHICHSRDKDYLDFVYAGARDVQQIGTSRVANYRLGRWSTYPVHNHLRELEPPERIQALADFVRAQIESRGEPRNYEEWCLAQYGAFLSREFYAVYTAKYWRVAMAELGTDWLSGRLLPSQIDRVIAGAIAEPSESQAVFAQFHYPKRGGYFSFYRDHFARLPIRLGHRVCRIDLKRRRVEFENGAAADFETLASSLALPDFVRFMGDVPASVAEAAAALRHTQLLCVNLILNRPRVTDLHWFYIYDTDVAASRVSVVSNLGDEAAAAQQTALQAEIFRRNDEALPVEELVENTVRKLQTLLGFQASEIVSVTPVVVPHAYVISDHKRSAAVAHLLGWLQERRIFSMGLFGRWKYVWSDQALRDGEITAKAIAGDFHP